MLKILSILRSDRLLIEDPRVGADEITEEERSAMVRSWLSAMPARLKASKSPPVIIMSKLHGEPK